MRIGVDATPLLGEKTGVGWYTYDLVDEVAAQDPDDEVLAFPISWRTARALEVPARPNVRAVRRLAPARPLWTAWDRFPFPPLELFLRCDVFHATNYICPPAWKTPTVVTVHDIWFVKRPGDVPPAVARMGRLLPNVLDRTAAVITVSHFTAGELAMWQPAIADRIRVVPSGFHRRLPPPARTGIRHPDEPFVLMLGTVDRRKNLPLALDALRILRERGCRLRLVVAGAVTPMVDIEALLRERDLGAGDVVVTGYVDDQRVADLLSEAVALVFPSLYEGFGMPLLEAMDAGVPVVAARAGAVTETVGGAAILVDGGDAGEFADAMLAVVTDDQLRSRLAEAGRARAEQFSWRAAAAATRAVYDEVSR